MARWILAQDRSPARRTVPDLDEPGPNDVTDHEILVYARTLRDGTVTAALARQTCIIALGLGGPVADGRALERGNSVDDIIAQARTWCVVQILERAEFARNAANPSPVDGPSRYRDEPPLRNRARKAREMAGLSVAQAVKLLSAGWTIIIDGETLVDIEANDVLYPEAPVAAMANLYRVSPEWLSGEVPEHDYARIDSMTGADKLTPGDRDAVAQFVASLPRNGKTAADRIAEVAASNAPPRIFTPRDDGACAVCGEPLAAHDVDVDDGCPVAGAGACRAVFP